MATAWSFGSFGSRRGSVEPSSRITRRASTTVFLAPPEARERQNGRSGLKPSDPRPPGGISKSFGLFSERGYVGLPERTRGYICILLARVLVSLCTSLAQPRY